MEQHKLSTRKRLNKPILFGTLLLGLAAVFVNRHAFFSDVAEIRAQEQARNEAKRLEILKRRERQMEELAEKKHQTGRGMGARLMTVEIHQLRGTSRQNIMRLL